MHVQISLALSNPCPACNELVGELVSNLEKLNLVACTHCGHIFRLATLNRADYSASPTSPLQYRRQGLNQASQ